MAFSANGFRFESTGRVPAHFLHASARARRPIHPAPPVKPDDEIFAEALDLPVAGRAAFLDRVCGDAAQRARLASLLAGHEAAADFLERPAVERPAPQPEEKPGDRLGRYTLLRKIGEGGCGVVYLAEQTEPVRRRVALKVIKLGMDTRSVIARFEAERQALAMMDHPDIARVFDAGATDAGRPYFVMEYVDGVPITRFCDEHGVPMAARLELFARVCLAMQHAHQKGVIHRDVKPSNILVALQDGVPSPKVIDFGIAKATQGRLTEHTLFTGLEQFIGTPAYMSPEQAELRELDVDTRSDVYSLGVLLYELLTGQPPFDPRSLGQAGVDEIRRIIREVEPPRPSTRVATLTHADRATVARLRHAGPAQLTTTLRGDLDWIVMRCLEKDRDRRYGTAHELAEDVRRHLRQEPVVARPPSAAYRLQRFVARNRLACASVAAVALALVLGTVVSVRQAVRATRAERTARAERDTAEAAGRAEALARADAQRRQEQAEDLLAFMLGDFRAGLEKIGRLELLDAVGEKALAYFGALDLRDLTDTALARQAKALTQIGEIRLAEARYGDAAGAFSTAYDRASALVARHPRDGDMLFERAQAEYWIGYAARLRGDFAGCREWFTHYRDSAVALAALEGATVRAQTEVSYGHHNLAALALDRGDLAAARAGFQAERETVTALLAASPDDSQLRYRLADIASWLGTIAERDGAYAEALERYSEMASRMEALVALEPKVTRWQTWQAEGRIFAGNTLLLQGRGNEAYSLYTQARSSLDSLVARDPKNRDWLITLLTAQLRQSMLLQLRGDTSAAQLMLKGARDQLELLVEKEPSSHVFTRFLATVLRLEAQWRFSIGRHDAANACESAIVLGERLAKESRADNYAIGEFAQSCILAGRIATDEGNVENAQRHWLRAVEILAPHLKGTNDWRFLDPAAQALTLLGRTDEARPLVEKLKRFGYHSVDPLAAPILDVVVLPANSTQAP